MGSGASAGAKQQTPQLGQRPGFGNAQLPGTGIVRPPTPGQGQMSNQGGGFMVPNPPSGGMGAAPAMGIGPSNPGVAIAPYLNQMQNSGQGRLQTGPLAGTTPPRDVDPIGSHGIVPDGTPPPQLSLSPTVGMPPNMLPMLGGSPINMGGNMGNVAPPTPPNYAGVPYQRPKGPLPGQNWNTPLPAMDQTLAGSVGGGQPFAGAGGSLGTIAPSNPSDIIRQLMMARQGSG
jgi:hypothetical protein